MGFPVVQTVLPTHTRGARPVGRRRLPRPSRPSSGVPDASRWTLDPRDNSLNLIRLGLALIVLVSHSLPLSGRTEPILAGKTPGSWAVVGFFALSGYLITGSRLRSDGARYLMSRIARILPGYFVSLVVVAFALAPIAYVVERGTLDGFLTTSNTPLNFVLGNALLKVQDYSVAGTLADVPYAYSWNGSLWSLYFEFLCYAIIGVAAIVPVVRRSPWPIVAMFVVSVVVQAQMPTLASYAGGSYEFTRLAGLLPFFLGGAVVFVLKERCPLRWYFAVAAAVVALGVVAMQPDWGAQLTAPLFTYALLWVASALPSPDLAKTHDLSYGVYVYAWPVTQMLVLLGVARLGWGPLVVVTTVATLVLASLSWLLVERPAKELMSRRPAAGHRPAQPAVPQLRSAGQEVAATPESRASQSPLGVRTPSDTCEQPVPRIVPVGI